MELAPFAVQDIVKPPIIILCSYNIIANEGQLLCIKCAVNKFAGETATIDMNF